MVKRGLADQGQLCGGISGGFGSKADISGRSAFGHFRPILRTHPSYSLSRIAVCIPRPAAPTPDDRWNGTESNKSLLPRRGDRR